MRFDAQTQEFSLQTPRARHHFRKNNEVWQLHPSGVRADAGAISEFLVQLANARTRRWLDEGGANAAKFGLGKPQAKVTIGASKLEIGARQNGGGFAARNSVSPAIWLLPDAVRALIDRPTNRWREKRFAVFEVENVARLEISNGKRSGMLVCEGESWKLENGKNDPKVRSAALDLIDFVRFALSISRIRLDVARNLVSQGRF